MESQPQNPELRNNLETSNLILVKITGNAIGVDILVIAPAFVGFQFVCLI